MSISATRQVTLNGSPLNLSGNEVTVGRAAPVGTADPVAEVRVDRVVVRPLNDPRRNSPPAGSTAAVHHAAVDRRAVA